jgi:formate-dependent nitrite reductase membrane component NrfD
LIHILMLSLLAGLAMVCGDLFMKHGSEESIRAGALLLTGALSKSFWIFVVGLGVAVPAGLFFWQANSLIPQVAAALSALVGLWMYEHLWIKAGQAIPLS